MPGMPSGFEQFKVSIALIVDRATVFHQECLASLAAQDHANIEILIAGSAADCAASPELGLEASIRLIDGSYANRAAAYNAAIEAASGEFLLLLLEDPSRVRLRRSAVSTMLMAATRCGTAPVVYADYERLCADSLAKEVHLLDWHPGRLRDSFDMGCVVLLNLDEVRRVGGFNPEYEVAAWYDLRLRLGEANGLVHIANRYAGSLYSVDTLSQGHNVFDYLLADKSGQEEMEHALTAHLQRTQAYLAPDTHHESIHYAPEEEARFSSCIASVIIPVNQRPEFIGRAIESVRQQTIQNVEVIVVVNGGLEDPTSHEVRRYMAGGDRFDANAPAVRLIVVDVNNLGLCLNSGLGAACGKYYVQLDSDDRLKPDAIESLLAVFEADPAIGMVIGSYEVWTLDEETGRHERNEEIPVVTHDEWTAENGRNNLLRVNGAGAPRAAHIQAIRDVGWFGVNDDADCRNYGEDYDLVLRMSERYSIGRVWSPIYEVIRHAGGTDHSIDQATIDRNNNAKDHMRLQALARRRTMTAAARTTEVPQ